MSALHPRSLLSEIILEQEQTKQSLRSIVHTLSRTLSVFQSQQKQELMLLNQRLTSISAQLCDICCKHNNTNRNIVHKISHVIRSLEQKHHTRLQLLQPPKASIYSFDRLISSFFQPFECGFHPFETREDLVFHLLNSLTVVSSFVELNQLFDSDDTSIKDYVDFLFKLLRNLFWRLLQISRT
ncbi:hypothetical protein GEMRC1_003943 [Eukaryota sp. GEM-RC1]